MLKAEGKRLAKDEYRTIVREGRASIKVGGSRFLARAMPLESGKEADGLISGIRREYHDATHNCFAYRVNTAPGEFRFSDDGEPSGTAGRPILMGLDRYELTNVLVVVTRYFGGTKLGTGGLARAYGEAADKALKNSTIVTKYETSSMTVSFPHSHTGRVMRLMGDFGVTIESTMYDLEVHLRGSVRKSMRTSLREKLADATGGQGRIEFID